MKTKLDLYLAVQNLAAETLAAPVKQADEKLVALLTPLKLESADATVFSQLFWSRRHRMTELANQPLEQPKK